MKPGDLIGFESEGVFAFLIRLKQRLMGIPEPYRRITHIALVTETFEADGEEDAWLVQAVRHVNEVSLRSAYPTTPWMLIPIPADAAARANLAVRWAKRRLGLTYGFVTIFSLALNTITPQRLRIDFTKAGSLICSGLGAQAWQQAGVDLGVDVDPVQVTPGQLAMWFGKG